ncbi:M13 family metallopeptidase [Candidatus Lokiarchaeum ossiferum]|uniref:M13 family metallopeptidase n=1 Tax=Candidatus Lokiarchaeum ossiferum TaxID=2951803 RepID=UPI00352FE50A
MSKNSEDELAIFKNDMNAFQIDKKFRPQDDFDNYVNGVWKKTTEIPDDQSQWGSFNTVRDETSKQLKKLLDEEQTPKQYQKVMDLFRSGMNLSQIEQVGFKPIQFLLNTIDNLTEKSNLLHVVGYLQSFGISTFISLYVFSDSENPELQFPHLFSAGLGLPDRAYYLKEEKKDIRAKYKQFIFTLLQLSGYSDDSAIKYADLIFDLERKLAEVTYQNFERGDPEKYFNKMELRNFQKLTPLLNWSAFFETTVHRQISSLSVDNIAFYRKLDEVIDNTQIDVLKNYLKFKVLNKFAPYLHLPFEKLHFDFYSRTLKGQKTLPVRWKRILNYINGWNRKIGQLLGKFYVDRYFSSESKDKMLHLIHNLQKALKDRLLKLDWMSESTKKKALLKHAGFRAKIGYPDNWTNFDDLNINFEKSYIENILECEKFDFRSQMEKIYEPTNRDEWGLHPQSVDAIFNYHTNEITFPAALLQYPFFDKEAHDPINYGAIGFIIGHEMTHAYDNVGRKFDHKGVLKNWWTEEDSLKFEAKTKYYEKKFNTYTVNGNSVSGKLTLGENIADLGGLNVSFEALKMQLSNNPGVVSKKWSPEQEFCLSFARVWQNKMRPETAELRLQTDPHSPPHWRINGSLTHFPPFHKAFDVKPEDLLYCDDYVTIW